MAEPIAYVEFVDGALRPIFEEHGRQYVIDDDGEAIFGVWFIPRDECDAPVIVEQPPA